MADGLAPTLGEIIRRQRELSAMSMRQFAGLVGISNPYLSQIERGLREPSEKVLDAIARNLDVSAEVLYQQAGLDPEAGEAEESATRVAIREDPRLSARQRQALLEVYDAFVGAAPGAPAPPPSGGRRRRGGGGRRVRAAAGPGDGGGGEEELGLEQVARGGHVDAGDLAGQRDVRVDELRHERELGRRGGLDLDAP